MGVLSHRSQAQKHTKLLISLIFSGVQPHDRLIPGTAKPDYRDVPRQLADAPEIVKDFQFFSNFQLSCAALDQGSGTSSKVLTQRRQGAKDLNSRYV